MLFRGLDVVDAECMHRLRVFGFRTPLYAFFFSVSSISKLLSFVFSKTESVAFSALSRRRRALNGLKTLASVLAGERGDRQTFPRKGSDPALFSLPAVISVAP